MEWILVIFIYAGAMSSGDNVTVTTIPHTFSTEAECVANGKKSGKLVSGTSKSHDYVCLSRKKI